MVWPTSSVRRWRATISTSGSSGIVEDFYHEKFFSANPQNGLNISATFA
jgi:hypothetical protein